MSSDRRISRSERLERDVALLAARVPPVTPAGGRPALVVLSGLPGTGKSHLARELAGRRPLAVLESDAVRKALIARPAYSTAEHERVFAAIQGLAERLLQEGVSVLVDATNLKEAHRLPFYDIAARTGAGLLVVRLTAPDQLALQRLENRSRDATSISDAGPDVFMMLRQEVDPIGVRHVIVDTSRDISEDLDAIAAELQAIEES